MDLKCLYLFIFYVQSGTVAFIVKLIWFSSENLLSGFSGTESNGANHLVGFSFVILPVWFNLLCA